jgi:methionine--tRNA ligase beta chain
VWNHPDSDKLYCEEVECGEAQPRSIASGLRAHHTLAEMQNRLICVVCNLKPAKLAGFVSDGMVLAAQGSDGKVELVRYVTRFYVTEHWATLRCD